MAGVGSVPVAEGEMGPWHGLEWGMWVASCKWRLVMCQEANCRLQRHQEANGMKLEASHEQSRSAWCSVCIGWFLVG